MMAEQGKAYLVNIISITHIFHDGIFQLPLGTYRRQLYGNIDQPRDAGLEAFGQPRDSVRRGLIWREIGASVQRNLRPRWYCAWLGGCSQLEYAGPRTSKQVIKVHGLSWVTDAIKNSDDSAQT
jgi:hypothetical protein